MSSCSRRSSSQSPAPRTPLEENGGAAGLGERGLHTVLEQRGRMGGEIRNKKDSDQSPSGMEGASPLDLERGKLQSHQLLKDIPSPFTCIDGLCLLRPQRFPWSPSTEESKGWRSSSRTQPLPQTRKPRTLALLFLPAAADYEEEQCWLLGAGP